MFATRLALFTSSRRGCRNVHELVADPASRRQADRHLVVRHLDANSSLRAVASQHGADEMRSRLQNFRQVGSETTPSGPARAYANADCQKMMLCGISVTHQTRV